MHMQAVSLRSRVAAARFYLLALFALMVGLLFPFATPAAHAQTSTGGTVVAWGDNELGQTSVPADLTDVTAISGGYYHSLALKRDGTVVAWGDNSDGEINVPSGLTDVIAIAAEGYHSLALKRDGTVVAWGGKRAGESSVPADLNNVIAISAGEYHSLALKSDGTVVAWGSNNEGQLDVPAGLSDVVAIASGGYHNVALKRDGTVVTWGYMSAGYLKAPAGLSDVVRIDSGSFHSMAFKRDGSFVIWGSNDYGQLNVPTSLQHVVALAGGGYHTLALIEQPEALPTINHSASVQVIDAPTSVVEGALESSQYIRAFTERQNYTLPQAITINGTTIAAGTKVNIFSLHADKVGDDNTKALNLSGWVSFDTKVLGVIRDGAMLLNSNGALGSTTTAYSTRADQGVEYGDSVTQSGQNQVNVSFSLWNGSDNVRVITLAQ